MKRLYIYYPVIFLLFVFCLDKIFTLEYFRKNFIQSGNGVYYTQRRTLFERMKKDKELENRSLALAFGDSRAYPYSVIGFEKKFQKDWILYNFSGPQAVPAYGYYWFEKIIGEGFKPKMVFYVISPEAFDDTKGVFYDPFLKYGADDEFLMKHLDRISFDDRKKLFLDRLFAVRRVNPDLKLFAKRLQEGKLREYDSALNTDFMVLNLHRGEQFAYTSFLNDPERLEKDALRIRNIYLSSFELGSTQFYFVEEFLKLAKANDVKVYLIWPKVYETYRKRYDELGFDKIWWPKVKDLARSYSAIPVDLNSQTECKLFYDASHQSIMCFLESMKLMTDDYYGTKKIEVR
ncbi:DUF1574 domain-containing protein [Leptospira gomenensis]|uniref:DUF1574 domain-containing protein n=1 Tax=Leptospira gomenensis TaxID=2484974 RepID=A0A5F1YSC4_9LEPT|nr:DUF1574 domain-containing protein [Leptospira gomenensis]TGK38646.1 DUF1574 domain-containing protein [Leptospira gomenensis]TGK42883.1 DUF1574 domain-containing protein [Leptospira gomenensis]TGK49572.1 DUF1574 domain-containing protein [Leptospira gomenensis]TGK60758.1 DUF1574 domain-containing protein [Leptospira gomenensis]